MNARSKNSSPLIATFSQPPAGPTAPLGALGEYLARRDHQADASVGIATGLGLLVALLAKVVIGFVMIAVFVAASIF
ncbi:hypothetical protein PEC18_36900 [Paucibacter sp. O1-1]|nr:hypothetical protein [Paucibacter sp. O1-1]MDA3831233.1 hypothetical protein [Paucibacter sp. O1-1]